MNHVLHTNIQQIPWMHEKILGLKYAAFDCKYYKNDCKYYKNNCKQLLKRSVKV